MSDIFPTPPPVLRPLPLEPAEKSGTSWKRLSAPLLEHENLIPGNSNTQSQCPIPRSGLLSTRDRQRLAEDRSSSYGDINAYRQPQDAAKDRVRRDSMVVAEVQLNCNLELEQSFLSDISFHFSELYQRPESSVIIIVRTSQTLLFGGSSEPAYHMTITALASEIAPTRNKRSAALVQSFMQESLNICPNRGVIRFEPVAEANLATNNVTAMQEMEEIERQAAEDEMVLKELSRGQGRRLSQFTPMFAFMERVKSPTSESKGNPAKPTSGDTIAANSSYGCGSEKQQIKRRRSLLGIFRR